MKCILTCSHFPFVVVDKVEVSPILIQKGETKIALYGMGSMRDERLNRMWVGKKVRFLKPQTDDDDDSWLSIFCLHQNRDLGRGSKNCVHESMIPEWMDLVRYYYIQRELCELRELRVCRRKCPVQAASTFSLAIFIDPSPYSGCLGTRT